MGEEGDATLVCGTKIVQTLVTPLSVALALKVEKKYNNARWSRWESLDDFLAFTLACCLVVKTTSAHVLVKMAKFLWHSWVQLLCVSVLRNIVALSSQDGKVYMALLFLLTVFVVLILLNIMLPFGF